MWLRYSSKVVAPMQRSLPLDERRLQQVRCVQRAAAGRAGADHGVDLVHEQDRARALLELLQHRLHAVLEVAAELGAGHQRAHVEREDLCAQERPGHVFCHHLGRQALDDRRLAHAGIADEQWVVLLAARQHLDGPAKLALAPHQRLDVTRLGALVQVDGELLKGVAAA
jgi:hypothetical protein